MQGGSLSRMRLSYDVLRRTAVDTQPWNLHDGRDGAGEHFWRMEMKGGASKFVGMLGRVGTEVAGTRLDLGVLERSSRGGYGTWGCRGRIAL